MTPTGIVDDTGTEHQIDVLVMATGFQGSNYLAQLPVTGPGGRTLHEAWNGEPEAFLGITVPGFPNFFMLYGPNTNSPVVLFHLEQQSQYVGAGAQADAGPRGHRGRIPAAGSRPLQPLAAGQDEGLGLGDDQQLLPDAVGQGRDPVAGQPQHLLGARPTPHDRVNSAALVRVGRPAPYPLSARGSARSATAPRSRGRTGTSWDGALSGVGVVPGDHAPGAFVESH